MSSQLVPQDIVPITSGYIILMAVLAVGLRLDRRASRDGQAGPATGHDPAAGHALGEGPAAGAQHPAGEEPAAGAELPAREGPAAGAQHRAGAPPAPGAAPASGAAAAPALPDDLAEGARGRGPSRFARRFRPGWPRLAAHVVGTAVGGYVLLMAIVLLYYYGVARVANQFLESAFTGSALLLAVALPCFGIGSWLVERRRRARPASEAGSRGGPADRRE
ncbi:MAG TPA: DUF6256 family protein [Streptosporangiaceae bacterium]|nr:DUF6256 family protein [Streptosporangiaceae bacterium]